MTTQALSDAKIDAFLARLRPALRGMPDAEIADVLRELRSHITELAESHGSDVETAIQSLGDPMDLAKNYRAENLLAQAECSGSPLVILQGLRHASRSRFARVTGTVLYIFGYANVVTLWGAAIDKIFTPSRAGVWYTPGDMWSLSLLSGGEGAPGTRELLGWWLIPAAVIAGWFLKYLTDRIALWWIRRYRRSRDLEQA